MQVTTIGLDIAKNVFQVHGIDANEKVVLRKQLRRSQVIVFLPHREVVWVNLADFDRCLLLLLPLWACGQRFFSVVHMPTAMTWGCRWFGRPDLMMVGRERAVRQFRNLAAL